MEAKQHIWRTWADVLQRWGLRELIASFLEAGGPLTLLFAQAVYLGQPILAGVTHSRHLDALADMLEDAQERRSFVDFLRKGDLD